VEDTAGITLTVYRGPTTKFEVLNFPPFELRLSSH